LAMLTCAAEAQVSLSASNVYSVVGEYSRSYFRSNFNLSPLIGHPGSNYWDFSQPQTANDTVSRMDVVPVSDGGHGTDFSGATFAWRYSGGAIQGTSWEYYSLNPTNGLVFYGTYYPVGFNAIPSVLIIPLTPLLPPVVVYGDSWKSEYEFDVQDPLFGDIPALYEAVITVDAFGMLQLPGLKPIPALRISQSENYYEYDFFFDTWDLFQQDTNWLWLAPGIGFAAQATSFAPNEFSPPSQPYTNSFSRVFSSPVSSPLPKVSITLAHGFANLSWGMLSNITGYLVEESTNVGADIWMPVAQTISNSWQAPLLGGGIRQKFYRVRGQP